ncbi:MAG: hypothetical protein HGA44_22235 [Cellulomonadaceae bacterium]|nr:hypothetical protein [Cellulomonadaceae bacterium]
MDRTEGPVQNTAAPDDEAGMTTAQLESVSVILGLLDDEPDDLPQFWD